MVHRGVERVGHVHDAVHLLPLVQQRQRLAVVPHPFVVDIARQIGVQHVRPLHPDRSRIGELNLLARIEDLIVHIVRFEAELLRLGKIRAHPPKRLVRLRLHIGAGAGRSRTGRLPGRQPGPKKLNQNQMMSEHVRLLNSERGRRLPHRQSERRPPQDYSNRASRIKMSDRFGCPFIWTRSSRSGSFLGT